MLVGLLYAVIIDFKRQRIGFTRRSIMGREKA